MTASDVATEVGLYLLVSLLSFLWALTEILQAFRSDVPRARPAPTSFRRRR